jgi:YD repeat-containing protein
MPRPFRVVFCLGLLLTFAAADPPLTAQSPIQYVYDEIGRLIAVIDRSGDTATYTYDAVGNILSIGRQRVRWCGRQRNGSGFDSRRFRDQGDWLDAVRDLSRV